MEIIIGLFVLIYSAILHEIAHGYVADRLGDPTARLKGRLTLNPLKHIDPYFTILMPLLLYVLPPHIAIGGAKPVPVDPFNLKEGRKDVALVSLAGPLTNVLLAVIAAILLKIIPLVAALMATPLIIEIFLFLSYFLHIVATINLYLAIFNLLPIPPLDGSKIFALFLPERQATAYLSLGSIGIFILLILLVMPIGGFSLQSLIFALFSFASILLGV